MIDFQTLSITLLVLLIIVAVTTVAAILCKVRAQRMEESRKRAMTDLQAQFKRLGTGEKQAALTEIAAAFRGPWAPQAADEVSRLDAKKQEEIVRALEKEGIAELYLNQAKSSLKWRRIRALHVLGELRLGAAVPVLLRSLEDRDPDIRSVAARTLGGMKLQETEEALIALLGRHEPSVSARIAAICIEIGPRTGPLLIGTLENGNAQARFWAARILGEMKETHAAKTLETALADSEPDVRSAAAWALGRIADGSALEILKDALDDPVWYVRAHAAESLGRIGDSSAAPALGEALRDESWWVRRNALDALVRIGAAAKPALLKALESDDRFAQDCATEALAALGQPVPATRPSPQKSLRSN
jgi:HEAT repeat protein